MNCSILATYLVRSDLPREEWMHVRAILDWFNGNLPHPPNRFDADKATFWFRSSAADCIDRIWELVGVLREHGYFLEIHKCARLANICWQDRMQVAAYPSRRDARVTIQ